MANAQTVKHESTINQETAVTALGTDTYSPLAEDHLC